MLEKSVNTSCYKNYGNKVVNYMQNVFSAKTLKKRVPILGWIQQYTVSLALQDTIAGITVGLTAIAQGLAFATVAGLPPEFGLYSGLIGGLIYTIFGTCKDASIGPTAIISALIARHISGYNTDFAILAAFLAGIIEILMGLLHLGFLVQYISKPVIIGFTNAAAVQIIMAQLKSFCGYDGPSGNYFQESLESFIKYVNTSNACDLGLGSLTIFILCIMQRFGQRQNELKSICSKIKWYVSLSRNVLVVVLGMIIACGLYVTNFGEPITLIGEIKSGLPSFKAPPFTTVVRNETYSFEDMVRVLGPPSLAIPLISVLEIVALASAFSEGTQVDASQEMIALGLCNIIGSFVSNMPLTSSFSRGAINRASGAQTPAGGIFTCLLITLSLSLLTSTFYFIPKSTLAAMIIIAMYSLMDFKIYGKLWVECKGEFCVMIITIVVCLFGGLEYGIVAGVSVQALMLLYSHSKPSIDVSSIPSVNGDVIVIKLPDNLSYCGGEYVRRVILRAASSKTNDSVIVDGTCVKNVDYTTATILIKVLKDLTKNGHQIKFKNFSSEFKNICVKIYAESKKIFVDSVNSGETYLNATNTTKRLSISISKL